MLISISGSQGIRKKCVKGDNYYFIFKSGICVIIAVRVASTHSTLTILVCVKRG